MNDLVPIVLTLTALTSVRLLGSSRILALIDTVAIQGLLLGLLPLLLHADDLTLHLWVMAVAGVALKAIVFPRLLRRAVRETEAKREVEPFLGYSLSLLVGLLLLGLSAWLGMRLPLPRAGASPLLVPVAFFTLLTGLLLIVSRRKAVTQVIGYIAFENGVYAFGAAIADQQPVLVETGVLLDLFVAVFVMALAAFHIQREFDHMDVDRLSELSDSASLSRPEEGEVSR